jgi:nucleoside-diphosphate-sugar epimerase
METILITGSGGFIGKNLTEYLRGQYKLLTPRSFELDLTDTSAVLKYFSNNSIDFVINCATKGGVRGIADAADTAKENLKMFKNLLSAKSPQTRIIVFGSGAQYDKSRQLKKVKENELGKYIPKDLYGKSKMEIANLAKSREDVLCLNIFGCYGKGERETRFPTYAITQNLKKQPIEINQNIVFDYLFIDDLCKIIEIFIKNQPFEKILNVTPTQSISILEISKIINKISDFSSKIIIKNSKMNNEYTGDNLLLLKELPDFKFTNYKKGLNLLRENLISLFLGFQD